MNQKQKNEKQKIERLHEERRNNKSLGNYKMKIVIYNEYSDIWVEFQDKHRGRVHTTYNNFQKGNVKNPYHPTIHNVGFVGVGIYKPSEKGKDRKMYKCWVSMLSRCYDPYSINRDKCLAYKDCFVCKEWHNFQNFAEWYEKETYVCRGESLEIDKDILFKNNKIYSPETCVLVPSRINKLFTKSNRIRGEYPIGVHYHKVKKRLEVDCSFFNKNTNKKDKIYLGAFPLNRPFQAFTCYKNFKEKYIKQVADEYKDFIPEKLYNALYKYEVEIND